MSTYGKQSGSGGAGFSEDVLLKLADSAGTDVDALELLTALAVNTPGSAASTFLTRLINRGLVYNAIQLTPAGQTTDTATGTTNYKWTLNVAGTPSAEIQADSIGELILTGTNGVSGVVFRGAIGGSSLARVASAGGLSMLSCAIQGIQGANVPLASTLAITASSPNGGNLFAVSAGTGPVNLLASATFNQGCEITLYFNVAATLNHNATPSGGNLQMQLAGSVNATMAIGSRMKLVYVLGQGWVELCRAAA